MFSPGPLGPARTLTPRLRTVSASRCRVRRQGAPSDGSGARGLEHRSHNAHCTSMLQLALGRSCAPCELRSSGPSRSSTLYGSLMVASLSERPAGLPFASFRTTPGWAWRSAPLGSAAEQSLSFHRRRAAPLHEHGRRPDRAVLLRERLSLRRDGPSSAGSRSDSAEGLITPGWNVFEPLRSALGQEGFAAEPANRPRHRRWLAERWAGRGG